MFKLDTIKTETYMAGNFRIEIEETEDCFYAWLYHKDYGIKDLMFGSLKWQPAWKHYETKVEFIEMVEANLPDYIAGYVKEWMDE